MSTTVEEAVCRWVVRLVHKWPDLRANYDGGCVVELIVSVRESEIRWSKYANVEVADGLFTIDCNDDHPDVPLDDPEFFERAAEMLARELLTEEEFGLARAAGWRRVGKDGRVKWPRSKNRS